MLFELWSVNVGTSQSTGNIEDMFVLGFQIWNGGKMLLKCFNLDGYFPG
jgi:hypothetical protein